jgi:hypothetical protein
LVLLVWWRTLGAELVALVFSLVVFVPALVARCAFQASPPSPDRLPLVVDDLDRCQPNHLLAVMESIKLLLEDTEIGRRVQVLMLVEEEITLSIVPLVERLTWKDFELLVDLVFTAAGWRRIGILGKTKKHIDLDMIQPVTRERVMVQVKSKVTPTTIRSVAESGAGMEQYDRIYLVTHSPLDLTQRT